MMSIETTTKHKPQCIISLEKDFLNIVRQSYVIKRVAVLLFLRFAYYVESKKPNAKASLLVENFL